MVPFERPHPLSYLTSVDTFCVSCTVFEIIGIFVCMENPYSRPNFGGFPDFRTPYPNLLQLKPPKGTSLRQSASFEPSRMQIGRRVRAGRVPEKQKKKEKKEKKVTPPGDFTPVWGRHRSSDFDQTWQCWWVAQRNHPCIVLSLYLS